MGESLLPVAACASRSSCGAGICAGGLSKIWPLPRVAVGPESDSQIGVPGTILRGIAPDPTNSLRALIDQPLRQQVIEANHNAEDLLQAHVQGIGHEFWIDDAHGFSRTDQDAVIHYLFSICGEDE
jgi:hypothetical protein